jgi:hypothetical protein
MASRFHDKQFISHSYAERAGEINAAKAQLANATEPRMNVPQCVERGCMQEGYGIAAIVVWLHRCHVIHELAERNVRNSGIVRAGGKRLSGKLMAAHTRRI